MKLFHPILRDIKLKNLRIILINLILLEMKKRKSMDNDLVYLKTGGLPKKFKKQV